MINNEIYPWNQHAWEQFCAQSNGAALPHAFLLTGPSGIGKKALAAAMAQSLLCENRQANGAGCGHCVSCHWFEAGHHPDLRLIRPAIVAAQEGNTDEPGEGDESGNGAPAPESAGSDKKLSKEITIAQIRALGDFSGLTAVRGGARIALIYPAEAMNTSAANALLKTLEEPGARFHFFLITDAPHRLLPTIRSRCRVWPVKAPDRIAALEWLKRHQVGQADDKLAALGGSPLAVVGLEQSSYWKTQELLLSALSEPQGMDIPGVAKQLEAAIKLNEKERQTGTQAIINLPLLMAWLQRWTTDVLYCHFRVPIRYYPQRQTALQRTTQSAHLTEWLGYAQWLNRTVREAGHPVNMALFLEDCLLRYPALNLGQKGHHYA
jgi:DNA polymerase-3 subunit delta'